VVNAGVNHTSKQKAEVAYKHEYNEGSSLPRSQGVILNQHFVVQQFNITFPTL
jgi:hypothetical protein